MTFVVTSCGLFPSLGDLTSSDASTPDVANDVQSNEGGTDVVVAPDVDAGKATFIRTITIQNNAQQALPKNSTVGGGFATFPKGGLGALTAIARPPTSTAEWRAQITDPSSAPDTSSGFYYWFGYQHTGDFVASDPWVVWIARSPNQIGAEYYAD